ncbi:MAG: NADH-quinone oxidoreductase subunit NuoE [Geodermatophilaceae bacterium]
MTEGGAGETGRQSAAYGRDGTARAVSNPVDIGDLGASLTEEIVSEGVPPLTEQTRREAREIIARYPRPRSALLPMLHLVQSVQGYVSSAGVALCAKELNLTKAEVGAVVTFYTMFKRRPAGEYLISVCTNTLCGFLGGEEIYAAVQDKLGVGHDQTTPDGQFTLEHAECLAACDYAPVVTVNYEFFDQETVETTSELIDALRQGRRPDPSRGAPLCSFRQISREIAGFPDGERTATAVAGLATGKPTLAGLRLAAERNEAAPADPAGGVSPAAGKDA